MHIQYTVEELIAGCIANNRKFQKLLFDKYRNQMFGVCMQYCKSYDEAEDVLLSAFMSIFTKIQTYNGGNFGCWIRQIVVNEAINNYRKNLKHYHHQELDSFDATGLINSSVSNNVVNKFQAEDVMKILQSLPTGYAAVFNLYALEGYHHKEIAEMLGISVGTSKSQLSKARTLLKSKIKI